MKFNSFFFQPSKLIAVKNEIKKTFPTKSDIYKIKSQKAKEVDLEELLKKIREFSLDRIIYLADSLKAEEIIALAINYSEIPNELYKKINKIILHKKNKFLIKILWNNFAEDYKNEDLNRLLGNLLASFSKLNDQEKVLYNIFKDSSPLINMRKQIENNKITLFDFLEELDLIFENKISKRLAADLFSKSSKLFFIREEKDNLIKIFKELEINNLKEVVENYLFVFKDKEYQEELMYKIKDRLGDPREDYSTAWNNIAHKAKEKAAAWFNYKKLKEFFDSITTDQEEAQKRFSYWEKHVDIMEKVDYVKKYLQLFLTFDNFVVVEFGDLGNAVYFYKKDFFKENLAQYTSKYNAVNNKSLKYTYEARNNRNKYVYKVDHRNDWQHKVNRMLKELRLGRK
ncbi:hypothetical protein HSACCH_00808 [Halanaerobium saccharolyticum subsp. saccharolyticum DSM 6643]|uniref:Zorya protein ZorC EH domain-containing protein n=1 Tax=Halanaerobium saccharolyticum subsp. saccharolyticum DSM 6643 TaxID=1293054 RepID=M5DZU1_9FIRM|nr:EH signature domain-containing protein [Halanaerobium saccharolyticum]CCU78669.1 hypothetical protein HSACCH_00808 [Halanaerobium saccharolyticum subsp. saccharolyticum DSM 6643]